MVIGLLVTVSSRKANDREQCSTASPLNSLSYQRSCDLWVFLGAVVAAVLAAYSSVSLDLKNFLVVVDCCCVEEMGVEVLG